MCKHWGLHISMNIDCLGAVLGSFWVVWKELLWCLKAKLILWQFLRYWQFNKQYHGGYLLICLISWPLLIASRYDWYLLKGLFKGFWDPSRLCESLKNWWRYGWMKFVTSSIQEINKNPIEFSLSTWTWSRFKLSWLKSYIVQSITLVLYLLLLI